MSTERDSARLVLPHCFHEQRTWKHCRVVPAKCKCSQTLIGAPEEIRTPDPQIRSLVLYPAELRALVPEIRTGKLRSGGRGIAKGSVRGWQGSRGGRFARGRRGGGMRSLATGCWGGCRLLA